MPRLCRRRRFDHLSGLPRYPETMLWRKNPNDMKSMMNKNIDNVGVAGNRCLVDDDPYLFVLQQRIIEICSFGAGSDLGKKQTRYKQKN